MIKLQYPKTILLSKITVKIKSNSPIFLKMVQNQIDQIIRTKIRPKMTKINTMIQIDLILDNLILRN